MNTETVAKPSHAKSSPAHQASTSRANARRDFGDDLEQRRKSPSKHRFQWLGRRRIGKRELVHITSQMAIMTRSGVDIVSALDSLSKQSRNPTAQQVLQEIHNDVLSGCPFSVALSDHEDIFGPSYIASVTAGEASGKMWEVLAQLSKLHRSELKMQTRLRTMAAYPVILTFVSLVVAIALMIFVLPQFAKIFADVGTPLPMITQVLIGASTEMRLRAWIWIPVAIGLAMATGSFLTSPIGRRFWDQWMLDVVLLRDINRSLLTGRSCQLLGLLIDSGVPLLESLRLVQSSVKNFCFRQMFKELEENVLNGNGLGTILHDAEFIPDSAAEMIMTAERTGTLGSATRLIGEHYEEEGEEKLRTLMAVLEPAITVIMGAFVAFVVLAVALPMFDLSNMAR